MTVVDLAKMPDAVISSGPATLPELRAHYAALLHAAERALLSRELPLHNFSIYALARAQGVSRSSIQGLLRRHPSLLALYLTHASTRPPGPVAPTPTAPAGAAPPSPSRRRRRPPAPSAPP